MANLEYQKEYYVKHKTKLRAQHKANYAANKEKILERTKAYSAARNDKYRGIYVAPNDISDELRDILHSAAGINVFSQPSEALLTWISRLPPDLRAEILLLGLNKAISVARSLNSHHTRRGRSIAIAKGLATNKLRREKVLALDRIVELLDHHDVNGKLFGDCTRPDLLRAAAAAQEQAGELTAWAGIYRAVAGMLGTETVRAFKQRGKIVALLTTTFKEAY